MVFNHLLSTLKDGLERLLLALEDGFGMSSIFTFHDSFELSFIMTLKAGFNP